ncbi:MAG: hypothetical protein P1P90_04580 [Patescibacteria group bacterium]|nr:hypothetical protein [Patescibacteria group bacterium]
MLNKFVAKRRVKQMLKAFNEKKQTSNLPDEEICKFLLINWFVNTNAIKTRNFQRVKEYVDELYKDNKPTLNNVCSMGISMELPYYNMFHNYSSDKGIDTKKAFVRTTELNEIIESLIKR